MKKLIIISIVFLFLGCDKDDDSIKLEAPVAIEAKDITNTSFTANWLKVADANDYELDVATDAEFSSITHSLKKLGGPTVIDGLSSNSEYFYRVRATVNGGNPSGNSNVIGVNTLPNAPVATIATNITSSSFTANWNSVPNISEYVIYVSTDNFPANPPNNLPNYNGITISATSHDVIGLDAGTIYYYVVKAKKDLSLSEESNSIETITLN